MINNYLNKDVNLIKEDLDSKGLNVIILGNGKNIIKQYPLKDTNLIKGDKIFFLTNGDKIKMPDITGYAKTEVRTLADMLGIKLNSKGNGYAISQSIKKDSLLGEEKILDVEFKLLY